MAAWGNPNTDPDLVGKELKVKGKKVVKRQIIGHKKNKSWIRIHNKVTVDTKHMPGPVLECFICHKLGIFLGSYSTGMLPCYA
jgi:hypothetical protein